MRTPLWLCFLLGKALGIIFYLNGKKRRTAFKNIKMAFPEKGTDQIHKILRWSFRNLGLSIIEIIIAPRLTNYVQINGKENINTSEGGILVGIHEGNYELVNTVFTKDYKLAVLVKKQRIKGFDKFLNECRENNYGISIYSSLKPLIRHLLNNQIIGVIVDHGAEDNAKLSEFFSQLVPTPGGAVYLSKKFNKKIYPGFTYRDKGFHHICQIHEPLSPQGKSEEEMISHLNQLYENELRKHPDVYIWSYKRFKRKKNLEVLILSDGKIGHIKQTKAFLSFLREEENYIINDRIIEITYKNRLSRGLGEICAFVSGKSCCGCGKCLKTILTTETYFKLQKTYADIIISAGSLLAPINKLFSSYLDSKSVVILRPNIPLGKFDIAVIPKHDRVYSKNNVEIKGALVYPHDLTEKGQTCRQFFKLSDNKKISFLLGGPLSTKIDFLNNLKVFIDKLILFSQTTGYKLLISTSRRTPKEAEDYITHKLTNFKNTEAICYPSKTNYDFVFDGFISLSEIVFVSDESISMISEIISSKKPCVCVALENQTAKHNVFLQSIKDEANFLEKPYNIKDITNLKISNIFEQNKAIIKDAIRQIL
ncbi:MAG: mitochondrial fission ELM1 family protein [Candidatus Omnitrophica bacterium]|nr:mitochondrial fission ELM1 family protein [Candidatus Omnitrophota bacterium]